MKKLFAGFLALGMAACQSPQAPEVEIEPKPLFERPANFPEPVFLLESNSLTQAGFTLGKTLFYDGILSRDSSIACGECHRQYYGFTHHLHDLSHGINGRTGLRNALPLQNLAWLRSFQWDGSIENLEQQPIFPIEHPDEMDDSMENVVQKLRSGTTYPALFKDAYGTEEISSKKMLNALTQFMMSMVSADSKYDQVLRREKGVAFTEMEQQGMLLFEAKGCANCHSGVLFTDQSFRNNGLAPFERTKVVYENGVPRVEVVVDEGRFRVTGLPQDRFRFRVPSLRNVEVTLPYTHDGRFKSLREVLDFYSDGVQESLTLDPLLRPKMAGGRPGIPMSEDEKTKLIAFLKTLTDHTFLTDKRFAEPDGFPVR
ncbi:cytochrome-c peroxidase [Arundinibacter roseus]|uniref:Cytochrome-c peroxidase n=1 Tax=Arundinibacter roseus TaxID=2070510 RepID=A0A4R4K7C0_9BACT|nr:cytochrome c peroxidase [Arundinibacter roseus]TDB63487.1 cytochrome-c peroxidase [Arundinibacter roseus]